MNAPRFDLHWSIAAKRAVAEDDVADKAVATIAVRNRSDAGTMPIGKVDVLDKDAIRVVLDADVVITSVNRRIPHREVAGWP